MISMENGPMLFDSGSLWSWVQVKIWQVALGSWQLIQKNSVHQHKTPMRNAKTLYWSYTKNWTTQQLKKHVLLSHCAHRLLTSICHQNYSIVRKQGKEKSEPYPIYSAHAQLYFTVLVMQTHTLITIQTWVFPSTQWKLLPLVTLCFGEIRYR